MRLQALLIMGMQAGAAAAGGLPFDVIPSGRFSLGYSDRVPGADVFLTGDATLRLSFGRFGAEFGTYGRADALDTPHETYGTLTYDFGDARLAAGVPRPAYDGFAVSALEDHFPSLGIDRTGAVRSEATFGAMFGNYLPFGVALTGQAGGLRYGASVHHADGPDVAIIGLGAEREVGDWVISGAVEVSAGPTTEVAAKVQAKGRAGLVEGGAGYFATGRFGGGDLVELFASVEAFQRVTVSGVSQIPVDGGAVTGDVSARYQVSDRAAVAAGVASDAGSDPVFNAFVDFRF